MAIVRPVTTATPAAIPVTTADGCALEAMRTALANGGSGGTLADLAAAAVKTAQFKRRSF